MGNLKYFDLIKSKLRNVGYSTSDLDALATQVIAMADEKNINALVFLESYFLAQSDKPSFNPTINKELNSFRNGMSFTSQRHTAPETNRFVRRQIFDR